MFCGRLYKWKGVERSIEAIKSLPKDVRDNVVFVIIGDGEDLIRLKNKAIDCIEFMGFLDREKAISILKECNLYLHSSYPGGGLSTSLLEAMSCGCCPVASCNEGADEIVENGKNGFLVDFDNKKAVTDIIEHLYNNKNMIKKYGEKAKIDVKQKFNWDKSIREYLKIFSRITNASNN